MDMCNCLKMPTSRIRKILASIFVFLTLFVGAWAETYYWVGSDGNWTDGSNWNTEPDGSGSNAPSGGPESTDKVWIIDGSTITLTSATTIQNLNIANNDATATLNLDGYSLSITNTLNLGTGTNEPSDNYNEMQGKLIISSGTAGNATVSINTFDIRDAGENYLELQKISCEISDNYWVNGSGHTIITGDASSSFAHHEVNYAGGSVVEFQGEMAVGQYGQTLFQVQTAGTPGPGKTITISINASAVFSQIFYKADITGNEEYTFNSTTTLSESDNTITSFSTNGTASASITLTFPEAIAAGNGITFSIYSDNDELTLVKLAVSYTQNDSTTWTGNTSVWNLVSNWNNGIPANGMKVIIPNGCSHYPELSSLSDLLNSITIESGAQLSISGNIANAPVIKNDGTLTVSSSSLTADKISGSGTINLIGGTTALNVADAAEQNKIVLSNTSSTISGNFTLSNFNAITNMSSKSLTLDNAIITADAISLSGESGSNLLLAGSGTNHEFNTSSLTAEYLSIDSYIELANYTTAISNCRPTADSTIQANWIKVINNGWKIRDLSTFTYTWTGDSDAVWKKESNWDIGYIPAADCKIIIPKTTEKPIPILPDTVCYGGTISIANGASIKLGTANLILSGKEGTSTGTILTNNGTIIYTGTGRISNGTNLINDTLHGTVEYAAGGTAGNVTDFSDDADTDDYCNLLISGTGWKLAGTLKMQSITIEDGANCIVDSPTSLRAQNFTFNGSVTNKNINASADLTLLPYTATGDLTVPSGIDSKIAFSAEGTLQLGNESTNSIIFSTSDTFDSFEYKLNFHAPVTLNRDITVKNTVTANKNISGDGELIFEGTGDINFNAGTNTYSKVKVNKDSDSGNLTITDNCNLSNLTIVKGKSITFAGKPVIINYTDTATSGNLIFSNGANITSAFTRNSGGTTQISGKISAASVTLKDTTISGSVNITTTSGPQNYNGTINGTVTTDTLTLDSGTSNITFAGIVGGSTPLASLTVTGPTIINCTGITTSSTQTYNGTIQIDSATTIQSNKEIDFANTISGSKKLTVNTPIFKSAATVDNIITLNEIDFAAATTTIQTNTKKLIFNVSYISGNGKTIALSSGSEVVLANEITLAPALVNRGTISCNGAATFKDSYSGTGARLTLSNGTTIFESDLDLFGTTFSHSGDTCTIQIGGTSEAPVTIRGPATFYDFKTSRSLKILGDNTFHDFTANTNMGGKSISFEVGKTQIINGLLSLSGADGSLLTLKDEGSGTSGVWTLTCSNSTISYVDVINSMSTQSIFAIHSKDSGKNTNWNFPGMSYTWLGGADASATTWGTDSYWSPDSIPGKGSIVTIPAGKSSYPVLTDTLDLKYNDTYAGSITIEDGGNLDLSDKTLTVGTITNNGLVRLKGESSQIVGTVSNGNNSTVEYYDNTSQLNSSTLSWGPEYQNLIIKKAADLHDIALTILKTTTIATETEGKTVSINNDGNNFVGTISIGDSVAATPYAGVVTLKARAEITLENNAYADSLEVQSAVKLQNVTTSGNQTYKNTVKLNGATVLTTQNDKTISFNDNVYGNNSLSVQTTNINIKCSRISTTGSQSYTGTITLGENASFDTANGDISFDSTINGANLLTLTTPTSKEIRVNGKVGETAKPSITIAQAGNVSFGKTVKANTFTITKAISTTFDKAVNITTFTDDDVDKTDNGTITFSEGGSITDAVTFYTTSTVSIIGPMSIGVNPDYSNLSHTTGYTNITGTINAAAIQLGDVEIISGTISGTSLSAGAVTTNGTNTSISTTGDQSYTGAFQLNGDTALSSTSNGDIYFASTINGTKLLTLTTPTSNGITINGKIGESAQPSITIAQSENVTFNKAVLTNAFEITQAAAVEFKETVTASIFNITKANSTTFDDSVTITTFTDDDLDKTDNGTITFSKGGSINDAVTFNTTSGVSITGSMSIGTASTYANLTHETGDTNITGTLNAEEIKLGTSSGTTTISSGAITASKIETGNLNSEGSITTSGEQKYNGTVELTDDLSLESKTSSITFASTITGAKVLTANTATGTSFEGNVGTASTPLTSLSITGPATIGCSNIYTIGAQTFDRAVTLNADTTLSTTDTTDGNISFNSTLDSKVGETHLLTLNIPAARTATFTGKVGNTTKPSITITQAGDVNFAETVKADTFTITKATSTLFNKAIELASLSDSDTHNGTITFKNGGKISTATQLHTTGNVSLTGILEALSLQLNNLVIDGTANIITKGTQVYNGTINGKVTNPDLNDTLELNSSTYNITFGGNIGQITKLKTLAVTGPAQINKNITITTDDLTFYTGLTSTTESAYALTLSNCNILTNPIATSTVTNIDFIFTGESGSTTNFIPGNSEYENITSDTITLNLGDNAFKQEQNASFTINSGSVTIENGGFNIGNLIVSGGNFTQTGTADDSVNNLSLTNGSLIWDSNNDGGTLAINGTVTEGDGLHINYNKKNIDLSADNTISGVFWNLKINDGITITNGGSIRIRKNLIIEGLYTHNNKELILGLDKTTPDADTTENGEISNTNTTLSDLGKVYINKSSSYAQTTSSDLLFTNLEITSGTLTIPDSNTITSSNLKNNAACTISNAGTIAVTKNFTDQGTYTDIGLLQFTGSEAQTFTPGTSTYKNIENISANPLEISGNIKVENFTINSGKATTFTGTTQTTNMTITSAEETTFADTVNITNFTDTANSGEINFKNGGTIATATEFYTIDALTIGDTSEDEMLFGTDSAKVDFTHIAGPTTITGKLHAKAITLGDTNTALTRIISGTINAESLTTGNLEAEGLITTTDYQQYDGTVELTNDLALKSDNSTITFDSTITGANALSADSSTDTSFGADAGTSTTKLTSLTITGPATIGSSNIFTSGPQSFSGAVTLTTTPTPHTLTAETITFDAASTIDGDSDLALVTSAGTSFGAKVGSNTSLSSLEVTGPATVACTEITTSGNQHYKNAIIFTSDSHLTSTSGNLTFDSTIDGEHLLTLRVPDGTTNTITVAGKVGDTNIPSVTIAQAGNVSFSESVKADAFEIKQAANTTFDDLVTISSFTDEATAGNITFNAGGSISDPTGTVFLTSGILTLGDTAADIMTFGSDETFADLIHIDGETSITGTLNTANLTLADTQGGPMKFNNSGLFKTLDGNSLTYTSSFEQLGEGNTVLGGNFTGNGSASFATNLQLYGSAQADFGTSGKNISIGQNLIINRDTTDNLTIKSNLSIEENLVLYNSPVIANADISAGQDIVILGSGYSETDTTTGITNEYAYKTPRHSDWSQPNYEETTLPDGSVVPDAPNYSAILLVSAGKEISAGINFYANGTELSTNGTIGQWNLKLPDLTNPANGFAEAYHSVVSGCKVICNDGTENGLKSRLTALECTDAGDGTSTPNINVEFEDFKITKAYTVRDNAIRVEFNQPIRYHSTTIDSLKFHNSSDAVTSTTNFTGFYEDPDCQHKLTSDITQHYTDEADGKTYYYFFIKAEPQDSASTGAWNTDATGKTSGASDGKSSDRHGIHHTALPCLDFPRALSGNGTTKNLSFIITDIWGKRLNNYSRRVPKGTTAEAAYGSANSSDASFIVTDSTGPVMWTVRTGQEMHTAYSAAASEAGQHSYDAHNFLEFRYSEPVEFTPLDPAVTENIQVTDTFGAIKEDDIRQEASSLTFAGIAKLTASSDSSLQLYTGKNGSPDKYVNALYRTDEYSLRLSIAGWTDGTVSDYSGNTYKNWTGYIEHASQFTRATAAPVTTATTPNDLIKDLAGNSQIEYAVNKIEPTVYSDSTSENSSALLPATPDLYSSWDTSEPVFTPLRFSAETEWGNEDFSEAIGNTNGSGSTLDRIDFHFFDNTPAYDDSDPAEWFTESGWCVLGSEGTKDYLYASYTYAADIIGGARQFDPISESDTENYRRTSGGIRLSTKLGAANGFKYSTDTYETNPATPFATGIENIHSTVISQLFTGSSEPQHAANDPDGLYLGIGITDTTLPVETSFAFKYDDSMAYLTDLAGNRLRSKTSKTIDRTPPSFDIILSPVNQNKIYIVFVKKIVTDSNKIDYRDPETGKEYNVAEKPTTVNFLEMLPSCFRIISINSDGSYSESTDLQIDTDIPATIVERYSDNHFTCICLTLNKIITTENVKNLYLQLSYHPDYYHPVYKETSPDPWTSNNNARVTFIQDELGNYMQMYSAHALSDFAIGLVNPLYAYSSDITENDEPVMNGLHNEGSWAVHDWNAEQKNYGTLPAAHSAAIVTQQVDGTEDGSELPENIRIYLSNSPDKGSVSTQFNKDFGTSLRVWLPDLTDGIFRALSAKNNSNWSFLDSEPLEEGNLNNLIFNIPLEMINTWKSGDQISFMFGITESDGSPVKIYNSPYYDTELKRYDFALSTAVPLYALRMHDVTDIGSLDLWSFRLKGITTQRGGVTILNNVINVSNGEKTVLKVDVPTEGRLNVMVMTLDGNIITYLHRGNAKAGENYFTWDGKNRNGNLVARGMYFIRVTGADFDETRKVMVVK